MQMRRPLKYFTGVFSPHTADVGSVVMSLPTPPSTSHLRAACLADLEAVYGDHAKPVTRTVVAPLSRAAAGLFRARDFTREITLREVPLAAERRPTATATGTAISRRKGSEFSPKTPDACALAHNRACRRYARSCNHSHANFPKLRPDPLHAIAVVLHRDANLAWRGSNCRRGLRSPHACHAVAK